jgi:S-adenosylmethionine hydrolase
MPRPIVFLSDFGLDDEFVGVCHGVIARIAPEAKVIDLNHSVPRHDVVLAAVLLADTVRYMPDDAVFLAIVDPGVGTDRREVAVLAGSGAFLVGPDNGLLSLAWERLGGLLTAVEIASPEITLEPQSHTFHGRDVFAPAAAHLANGTSLGVLGPGVDPESLIRVRLADPVVGPATIRAEVIAVDRFGNVELNARESHVRAAGLEGSDRLRIRTVTVEVTVRWAAAYGGLDEGEHGVMFDSRGWLAIVLNGANAAEALGLSVGDPVTVLGVG